ncbi:MAG: ADP-ribosylglycohydrolase family protein [Bacteroidota bacterium]
MTKAHDALLGGAIGDALGVPVEFRSRAELKHNPVTTMRGYGTYHQPPGTWSDDSSLTFCLAESLAQGFSLPDLTRRFINWRDHAYWTPHGKLFDIGITTAKAITRLTRMMKESRTTDFPQLTAETDEYTNGNGSLMRILPLYFYLKAPSDLSIEAQFRTIHEVSALTHGHIRAALACLHYLLLADEIVAGRDKVAAFQTAVTRIQAFFTTANIAPSEREQFRKLLSPDFSLTPEQDIRSSGYVVHSLEAAIWCFLNAETYPDTVLKAVNLGSDTDTTAAIAGGLAGLYYGAAQIPTEWLAVLVRRPEIEGLAQRLHTAYPIQ